MLKPIARRSTTGAGLRIAIVAARYNARYVNGMLRAAQTTLRAARVAHLEVIRVPGAFEIPAVAAWLAARTEPGFDAILCLGVILQGETTHADHVASAVGHALADIQTRHLKPVIHEVLQMRTLDQARVRCLDPHHNRGTEAAQTALAMGRLFRQLRRSERAE